MTIPNLRHIENVLVVLGVTKEVIGLTEGGIFPISDHTDAPIGSFTVIYSVKLKPSKQRALVGTVALLPQVTELGKITVRVDDLGHCHFKTLPKLTLNSFPQHQRGGMQAFQVGFPPELNPQPKDYYYISSITSMKTHGQLSNIKEAGNKPKRKDPRSPGVRIYNNMTAIMAGHSTLMRPDEILIGVGGKLPWHYAPDLKRFKEVTMGHNVIMGRKTYESLPMYPRGLPGRTNYVITSNKPVPSTDLDEVKFVTMEEMLDIVGTNQTVRFYVIGGKTIYEQLIPHCSSIDYTEIYLKTSPYHKGTEFTTLSKSFIDSLFHTTVSYLSGGPDGEVMSSVITEMIRKQ